MLSMLGAQMVPFVTGFQEEAERGHWGKPLKVILTPRSDFALFPDSFLYEQPLSNAPTAMNSTTPPQTP